MAIQDQTISSNYLKTKFLKKKLTAGVGNVNKMKKLLTF